MKRDAHYDECIVAYRDLCILDPSITIVIVSDRHFVALKSPKKQFWGHSGEDTVGKLLQPLHGLSRVSAPARYFGHLAPDHTFLSYHKPQNSAGRLK